MKGQSNSTAGPITLITTAETLIITSGQIADPTDFTTVFVWGGVSVTIGTAGTSAQIKLRRGPLLTSPLLFTGPVLTGGIAAGALAWIPFAFQDIPPGGVDELVYGVTLTIGAATGNSTAGYSSCAIAAMP